MKVENKCIDEKDTEGLVSCISKMLSHLRDRVNEVSFVYANYGVPDIV